MVVIGLGAERTITVRGPSSTVETHPPYQITQARATPSQSIGIALTPNAPMKSCAVPSIYGSIASGVSGAAVVGANSCR